MGDKYPALSVAIAVANGSDASFSNQGLLFLLFLQHGFPADFAFLQVVFLGLLVDLFLVAKTIMLLLGCLTAVLALVARSAEFCGKE